MKVRQTLLKNLLCSCFFISFQEIIKTELKNTEDQFQ